MSGRIIGKEEEGSEGRKELDIDRIVRKMVMCL